MKYAPQIIYFFFVLFGMLMTANKHGKPQSPYNFWTTLISVLIQASIMYWGGFFNVFFK
jgi:hypothetical protein